MKKILITLLIFLIPLTSYGATVNFVGFETGDTDEGSGTGTISVQNTVVNTGTYALRANPTTTNEGNFRLKGINPNGGDENMGESISYIRFYFRYATAPSSGMESMLALVTNVSGKSGSLQLTLGSDGIIGIYDGFNHPTTLGAFVASSTSALSADTWYRIELFADSSQSSGSDIVQLKIDGTLEVDISNESLSGTLNALFIGKLMDISGTDIDFFYDDVIISNSAFPVDGGIKIMKVNANSSYTDWTLGTGLSDYLEVDELPSDDNTTYVAANGTGTSTFAFETSSSAGITGTINSVKTHGRISKGGIGTGIAALLLISDGIEDKTSGRSTSGSSTYYSYNKIYDTDPSDASTWTLADLDSLTIGGVNEPDSCCDTRGSSFYIIVDYTPSVAAAKVIRLSGVRLSGIRLY